MVCCVDCRSQDCEHTQWVGVSGTCPQVLKWAFGCSVCHGNDAAPPRDPNPRKQRRGKRAQAIQKQASQSGAPLIRRMGGTTTDFSLRWADPDLERIEELSSEVEELRTRLEKTQEILRAEQQVSKNLGQIFSTFEMEIRVNEQENVGSWLDFRS